MISADRHRSVTTFSGPDDACSLRACSTPTAPSCRSIASVPVAACRSRRFPAFPGDRIAAARSQRSTWRNVRVPAAQALLFVRSRVESLHVSVGEFLRPVDARLGQCSGMTPELEALYRSFCAFA